MSYKNYTRGYCIQLGNGNNWCLTGYKDNVKYADILAEIMNLKECPLNEYSKIVFFNSSNSHQLNEKNIEKVLPDLTDEWKVYDYSSFRIWHSLQYGNIIIEYVSQEPSKDDKYNSMWTLLSFVFLRCLKTGGLPTHSGLAEYEGKGILFIASGGTGKSTACRRLPYPWKVLCDDENLIMPNKDGKFRVHPFPTWSDYLWERGRNKYDINQFVPLSAVFFLERSDKDEVEQLPKDVSSLYMTGTAYQVLAKILRKMGKDEQTTTMSQIFNNAFDVSRSIPSYKLKISLTGKFWKKVEEVITWYA